MGGLCEHTIFTLYVSREVLKAFLCKDNSTQNVPVCLPHKCVEWYNQDDLAKVQFIISTWTSASTTCQRRPVYKVMLNVNQVSCQSKTPIGPFKGRYNYNRLCDFLPMELKCYAHSFKPKLPLLS